MFMTYLSDPLTTARDQYALLPQPAAIAVAIVAGLVLISLAMWLVKAIVGRIIGVVVGIAVSLWLNQELTTHAGSFLGHIF